MMCLSEATRRAIARMLACSDEDAARVVDELREVRDMWLDEPVSTTVAVVEMVLAWAVSR